MIDDTFVVSVGYVLETVIGGNDNGDKSGWDIFIPYIC